SNSLKTPKAVIHHEFIDTPSGSVYWVPRVSASVLPVLGTVYDSLDECIGMYRKYASEADPKKNDRQVRSSNFRVCGCKARVVFDMVPRTSKYTLTTFDVEHNLELDRVEYKHLSKAERKYKMVFVPFTAIDNHRRSVTVGSGLLKKETAEAYGWLLRAFKKAFVRPPNIVKIPAKIVSRIYDDTDFKDKFGKIVWNMFIGPEEFEDRWNKLMEEFNLVNHKWLSKMYHLRSSWVPAFFVDSPLCGLMRTTSRSESENSFFSYFTSSGSTLVKFMLCYESAMERQRHTQEKLDHQSFNSFPALLTLLPIEEHAAKVYTRSLFIRVQKEIVAGSWLCSITCMSSDEGCIVCIIDEEKIKPVGLPEVIYKESTSENVDEEINLHQKVTGHYKVLYNKGDGSVSCRCQLFVISGILCRHIFCVFKNFKVSCILDQYILRRWTKDLIPPDLRNKKNRYGEKNEAIEKLAMEAYFILDSCVHILRNNEPNLFVFVNKMKAIKSDLKKPDKVKVKNPTRVRPKGHEKQKRMKNGREISIKKIVIPGGSDHVDGRLRDGASGSVSV
ncbi:FAR1-related sequence 5-like protein, partial [Tanacetum coccineum]